MEATPRRVQLSRKKGFRLPANTVKVDRSTSFGNPYQGAEGHTNVTALTLVEAFREYTVRDQIGKEFSARFVVNFAERIWRAGAR